MKNDLSIIKIKPKGKSSLEFAIEEHEALLIYLAKITRPADFLIEAIERCEMGKAFYPGAFMIQHKYHVSPIVYSTARTAYEMFRNPQIMSFGYPHVHTVEESLQAACFALAYLEDTEESQGE